MDTALSLIITAGLIALGYYAGRAAEKKHYGSIHKREAEYLPIPASTHKAIPDPDKVSHAQLAVGSVVVSLDYYKQVMAALRMIFGGEVRAYASLLDRARREAILRMKESCPNAGAYLNCRIETSSIAKSFGSRNSVGGVEVLAYATAVYYRK